MAAGWLNPFDDGRTTAVREPHVLTGAGVRKWFSQILRTRPKAQDFNAILAQLRDVIDFYGIVDVEGDDTLLRQAIRSASRERLTADRTYYVRSDGNDANTGLVNSAGGGFATKQKAIDTAAALDLNGHAVTIQIGTTGTATDGVVVSYPFLNGTVTLIGDPAAAANYVISTAGVCVNASNGGAINVSGVKLVSTGSSCIAVSGGTVNMTGAFELGTAAGSHMSLARDGVISVQASYTISGGTGRHILGSSGGQAILNTGLTVTLTGTPAFSFAFIEVDRGAMVDIANTTWTGAATGRRYNLHSTSQLRSSLATLVDFDTLLPGSIRGMIRQNWHSITDWRNILINPSGRIQDGPPGAVGDTVYGLHSRWYALTQTGAITPSTLTDVEDGMPHMMRITNSLGSVQRMGYAQIIEAANCKQFRSKTVTISARVRRDAAANIWIALLEWTGTEDVVVRDVVFDWTSLTFTAGNFFVAANINVLGTINVNPGANVLGNAILRAITLGSTFNNLIVVVFGQGTFTATTGFLDLRVQLEEGGDNTRFERRPVELERRMCQRMAQRKTFQSINGTIPHVPLIKMRATPTVTVDAGSAASVTADGFSHTHTAAATVTMNADAEL